MKLRPEGCKVLVEVDSMEEKTAGGLWIPKTIMDTHQHTMTIGTVVAVGPGVCCKFWACCGEDADEADMRELQEGDRIWFSKYGGRSFEAVKQEDRGRDLRIINDEDVMAILDEEDE